LYEKSVTLGIERAEQNVRNVSASDMLMEGGKLGSQLQSVFADRCHVACSLISVVLGICQDPG
jgi:hypothetical protein